MKDPTNTQGVSVLTGSDVIALLGLDECIDAVESAFRSHAEGRSLGPGVLGIESRDGGFHIKAAGLELGRPYFATKVNGNFFRNRELFNLPNIQGLLVLFNAENGSPLAVMDSIEITILRTGAATGVAAKHLAREDASVVTICGCGNQGEVSLRAVSLVRKITKAFAFDADAARAARYSEEMSKELGIDVTPVRELPAATSASDIIITCTPSTNPFLNASMVRPGTFIAAVGADNDVKQELDGDLLAASKIVVDSLAQCIEIGDLKLALRLGSMTVDDVHAELGQVISAQRPGRESNAETIIFDSSGTALQDVAAAAIVYERAIAQGRGARIDF